MSEKEIQFGGAGQTETAEHSSLSKAKKVIAGPLVSPQESTNVNRSAIPIHAAFAGALTISTLKPPASYRLISDIAFHMVQHTALFAGPAVLTDTYVPANTPVVIRTDLFPRVSVIPHTGSGIIQAVEVR